MVVMAALARDAFRALHYGPRVKMPHAVHRPEPHSCSWPFPSRVMAEFPLRSIDKFTILLLLLLLLLPLANAVAAAAAPVATRALVGAHYFGGWWVYGLWSRVYSLLLLVVYGLGFRV